VNLTFSDEQENMAFLAKQTSGIWRRHFNAMFTSYCFKPQGCGGLVRPSDDYYHNRMNGYSIHCSCATKWREKTEAEAKETTDADV